MTESSSEKVLRDTVGLGKEEQLVTSDVSSVLAQDQKDLKVGETEEAHQRGQDVYPLDEDPPNVVPPGDTPLVDTGDLLHLEAKTPEPAAPVQLENGQPDDGQSNVIHERQVDGESSEVTVGQCANQSQSADTASCSIPSLDVSEGNNGVSVDEALSSSFSALGAEAGSPCVEATGLAEVVLPPATSVPTPAAAAAGGAVSTETETVMPAYYFVKWITWKEKKTPIITQSENGPCPLLAIMNILFLRWKVSSERSHITQL